MCIGNDIKVVKLCAAPLERRPRANIGERLPETRATSSAPSL
jgi:hypothetical protein